MIEFNATLLVAMISFVVFMMIMNAIFYRPILNIIRKRDNYIDSNYNEANNLSEKAQNITAEYNEKLSAAKDEARHNTAVTVEEMQKVEFSKIQEAKENSKTEIQSRKEQIEQDKIDLQAKINEGIKEDLASEIVSKILGRSNG